MNKRIKLLERQIAELNSIARPLDVKWHTEKLNQAKEELKQLQKAKEEQANSRWK